MKKISAIFLAVLILATCILPVSAETLDKSPAAPKSSSGKKSDSTKTGGSSTNTSTAKIKYGSNPNDHWGYITADDKYIYQSMDVSSTNAANSEIHRISKADRTSTVIARSENPHENLNVAGDYLFYNSYSKQKSSNSAIFKIKKDGSSSQEIFTAGVIHDVFILNDKLYAAAADFAPNTPLEGVLWEMNLDGSSAVKVCTNKPSLYYITAYKDNIIVSGRGDTTNIYSYNTSTRKTTKIASEIEKGYTTSCFNVVGGNLYYYANSDFKPPKTMEMSLSTGSTPKEVTCDFDMGHFVYDNGYFYYYNSGDSRIYRTNKLSGGKKELVVEHKASYAFSAYNGYVASSVNSSDYSKAPKLYKVS